WENLARWQEEGLVPDMPIKPGANTSQPIWERGWSHWHHLFSPRQLHVGSIAVRHITESACSWLGTANLLDRTSKLCRLDTFGGNIGRQAKVQTTFYNQALNPLLTYAVRSSEYAAPHLAINAPSVAVFGSSDVETLNARSVLKISDLFVTDPPYADAVNYHEITEFFIAWLSKRPPAPFNEWSWDSHRDLAIKGKDAQFRRDMVAAYSAMTSHMPDNGIQVVMFTHQNAAVWADL